MKKSDARGFLSSRVAAARSSLSPARFACHARFPPAQRDHLALGAAAAAIRGSFRPRHQRQFFFGGIACRELCHKTPFATQFWNAFFLKIYSFISWFDPIGYRASHIRHHQVTTHADHDGEVVLPCTGRASRTARTGMGSSSSSTSFTFYPTGLFNLFRFWFAAARGDLRVGTDSYQGDQVAAARRARNERRAAP